MLVDSEVRQPLDAGEAGFGREHEPAVGIERHVAVLRLTHRRDGDVVAVGVLVVGEHAWRRHRQRLAGLDRIGVVVRVRLMRHTDEEAVVAGLLALVVDDRQPRPEGGVAVERVVDELAGRLPAVAEVPAVLAHLAFQTGHFLGDLLFRSGKHAGGHGASSLAD